MENSMFRITKKKKRGFCFQISFLPRDRFCYLSTHVVHLPLSVIRGVIIPVLETLLVGDIADAFLMSDSQNTWP